MVIGAFQTLKHQLTASYWKVRVTFTPVEGRERAFGTPVSEEVIVRAASAQEALRRGRYDLGPRLMTRLREVAPAASAHAESETIVGWSKRKRGPFLAVAEGEGKRPN